MTDSQPSNTDLSLVATQLVAATPERVFRAWTTPGELEEWWGPKGVRCVGAEIDLRVGGAYRIANRMPNGNTLWISGEFKKIEAPDLLIYSWSIDPESPATETVTVQFEPHDNDTLITVRHERIETAALRDQHVQGWVGCLDGVVEYLRSRAND